MDQRPGLQIKLEKVWRVTEMDQPRIFYVAFRNVASKKDIGYNYDQSCLGFYSKGPRMDLFMFWLVHLTDTA